MSRKRTRRIYAAHFPAAARQAQLRPARSITRIEGPLRSIVILSGLTPGAIRVGTCAPEKPVTAALPSAMTPLAGCVKAVPVLKERDDGRNNCSQDARESTKKHVVDSARTPNHFGPIQ